MQDTAKKVLKETLVFPPDITNAIKADKATWKNYQNFSSAYKRVRIAYIDAARKRSEDFYPVIHKAYN